MQDQNHSSKQEEGTELFPVLDSERQSVEAGPPERVSMHCSLGYWFSVADECREEGDVEYVRADSLDVLVAERDALKEAAQWRLIETAPKDGRTLLLGYPNRLGKWRTVRGQWFTDEQIAEWENADDFKADWYETSVENDEPPNCWLISPTHWRPLPAKPDTASPQERDS